MIRIFIKEYVDNKFDNLNKFAKSINIGYQAAQKLYEGTTTRIEFDTLESLCKVFSCTPNDILKSDSIDYNNTDSSNFQVNPEEYVKINQVMQLIDSRIAEIISNKKDDTE